MPESFPPATESQVCSLPMRSFCEPRESKPVDTLESENCYERHSHRRSDAFDATACLEIAAGALRDDQEPAPARALPDRSGARQAAHSGGGRNLLRLFETPHHR